MRRTVNKLLIFSVAVSLVLATVWYAAADYVNLSSIKMHTNGDMLTFSKPSGFYTESLQIAVKRNVDVPLSADIYYTLDGSDPTEESTRYSKKITLEYTENKLNVIDLKAVLIYKGERSEIISSTYVIGDSIEKSYGLPIINISTENSNLYDYYTGIFVGGYHYDEAVKRGEERPELFGNYWQEGDEWIRPAKLTLIDTDGSKTAEQNIGLSVVGGTSVLAPVKSLKLSTILKENGESEKLNILIPVKENSSLSLVSEYNSLRLRSGGQDREFTNIRSSVVSRLAEQSGFDGYSVTKRCAVFVNGNFYGIHDMQQNYSNSFLRNRFSLPDSENVETHKGKETEIFEALGLGELFSADLTLEENQSRLESAVDMDNFLHYYAINILMGNTDWPFGNYQLWRYTGGYDGVNKYTDGRFRFLIYDNDISWFCAYGEEDNEAIFFDGDKNDAFVNVMESIYKGTPTLSNVIKSNRYRDKFALIVCDLLNTAFEKENILKIIDEEYARIEKANKLELSELSEKANYHIDKMKQAVEYYDSSVLLNLERYFGVKEKYTLNIKNDEGVTISWNVSSLTGENSYTAEYFKGTEFTLTQQTHNGYSFEYWLVNGEKIYGSTLTVSADMTYYDSLEIETVTAYNGNAGIMIDEICARGSNDWIRLRNYSDKAIKLKNYYISDSEEKPMQFELPDISLRPDETITLNCKGNYYAVGEYICNFNLAEGETLLLSKNGIVSDRLYVPRMDKNETYSRALSSNTFVFNSNINNCRY